MSTNDSMILRLAAATDVWPAPVRGDNTVEVPLRRLLLIATIGDRRVLCGGRQLPFRSGSIAAASCHGLMEYLIDDQAMLFELARILAPGGTLTISAPHAGGLGRYDLMNARRYARDMVRIGRAFPVLAEIGWRRHYQKHELKTMITDAGFSGVVVEVAGLTIDDIALSAASAGRIRNPVLRRYGAVLVATGIRSTVSTL